MALLPPEEEVEVEAESEDGTGTLDIAVLGGKECSPGDRIELEVVSVDPDMGSVTVKMPGAEKAEGIDEMASEFDKPSSDY